MSVDIKELKVKGDVSKIENVLASYFVGKYKDEERRKFEEYQFKTGLLHLHPNGNLEIIARHSVTTGYIKLQLNPLGVEFENGN